jgi:hypothetical protein
MVHAYCADFRNIVILQQYRGVGSKHETCVTMVHCILNISFILTAILALTTADEQLLTLILLML